MSMTRPIDFSCKHNVLLLNPDGTYTPMDEPFFHAELIAPGTWKILSDGDFSYLVAGEREGVSIDTGYGAGNLRLFLEELCALPVPNVINTHHHFDHTAGNPYFEKAYMHPAAVDHATIPYASFTGIQFPRDYEFVTVREGDLYELGGRTLEFFYIPDHTPDGIAILDRKEHILFTGDELMGMPMGKTLNGSVEAFAGYLDKLLAHRHEFNRVFGGAGEVDISLLERYAACARAILGGEPGEPFERRKPQFSPLPAGPNGEMVYGRRMPRYGDGGSAEPVPPGNWYALEHSGVRIVYDRT